MDVKFKKKKLKPKCLSEDTTMKLVMIFHKIDNLDNKTPIHKKYQLSNLSLNLMYWSYDVILYRYFLRPPISLVMFQSE